MGAYISIRASCTYATRRGVAFLFTVEFGLLGLLGGLGALLLSWIFLSVGLDMHGAPSLLSIPIAALRG